ncbi:SMI1/KNR4 family protein [Streptomyces sp. NPDC057743]|uniref:SMI1/KNR4 family protein n=1 Tax=Streptomyces sp. NPDC057743 TaxID=3346236 RepID=UPI0036C42A60
MDKWDADAVHGRIRQLAAQDPTHQRFGADTHQYELTPALPEAEIRAFEGAHRIELPLVYRSFVAQVGNGPAGPGHGLMPLTTPRAEAGEGEGEGWAVDDEWQRDRLPGRLTARFRLTEPLPGRLRTPVEELTPGTLLLTEEGCGTYIRLILNGPRRGEVWRIDPDWAGFVTASPNFGTWYTAWLNHP